MTTDWKEKLSRLEKWKFPLLVLALGLALMLWPAKSGEDTNALTETDAKLGEVLSSVEGVGEARVLVSEEGVVVVCRGGDRAEVQLRIIRAVMSFTGLPSDRITVLKMAD